MNSTVVGVLFAVTIIGETLQLMAVFGAVIVLTATVLVMRHNPGGA